MNGLIFLFTRALESHTFLSLANLRPLHRNSAHFYADAPNSFLKIVGKAVDPSVRPIEKWSITNIRIE